MSEFSAYDDLIQLYDYTWRKSGIRDFNPPAEDGMAAGNLSVDPEVIKNDMPLMLLDTEYKSLLYVTHRIMKFHHKLKETCNIDNISDQSASFWVHHTFAGNTTTAIQISIIDEPSFRSLSIQLATRGARPSIQMDTNTIPVLSTATSVDINKFIFKIDDLIDRAFVKKVFMPLDGGISLSNLGSKSSGSPYAGGLFVRK